MGEDGPDGLLLNSTNQSIARLVESGKERGYITYADFNAALPQDQVSSEQIADVMAMLSEICVNVIEAEESDDSANSAAGPGAANQVETTTTTTPELERTDDPVRMYLREIGSVELLSRQGEIAIAKRIEAGREKMIGGICGSPLTMRAIIFWRDAILQNRMLLRDVIDLEATLGGTEVAMADGNCQHDNAAHSQGEAKPAAEPDNEADDDEFDDRGMSLAAMEAALSPLVLELFDLIAKVYRRLAKQQEARLAAALSNEEIAAWRRRSATRRSPPSPSGAMRRPSCRWRR